MRGPDVTSVLIGSGRRLRVRRWYGTGRPLVLLHGLLDDAEGWARLARRHPPPVPGARPAGVRRLRPARALRGSAPTPTTSPPACERLRVDDCTLVGHSLGGAVAAAVAERGDAVSSLALLAPAGFGRIRISEAVTLPVVVDVAELPLPLALLNPLVIVAAYSTFVSHRRLPSRDLVDRLRRRAFQSAPGVRGRCQAIAHAGRDPAGLARRRSSSRGPSPRSGASTTRSCRPTTPRRCACALPQAHVEVWDGMGHHPQRERPAQLPRFIERHAARARCGRAPASVTRRPRRVGCGADAPGDVHRRRRGPAPARERSAATRSVAFDDGSTVAGPAASRRPHPGRGRASPLDEVELLAPVPRPRAIFGIGLNYADHAAETGGDAAGVPDRLPEAAELVGAAERRRSTAPAVVRRLDYEGELAVVMGAGGEVAGYAVADDVSARDLQGREPQWTRAKGFDTPALGPVDHDRRRAAGDPDDLRAAHVGQRRAAPGRHDRGPDLRCRRIVGFLAEACTLEPGDLILTGTPAGVGMAMDPPRFLRPATSCGSRSRASARSSTPSPERRSGGHGKPAGPAKRAAWRRGDGAVPPAVAADQPGAAHRRGARAQVAAVEVSTSMPRTKSRA